MGANAVTTVPVYTAGEVLTAADLNITNSGIPVFASTVERDAAFGGTGEKTLAEGQYAFLEDTNATQFYDGASWLPVGVAPGLVRVGGGALSGSSTAFTSVFSATYDAYKIICTDGSRSTNGYLSMIFGATTSGYYWGSSGVTFSPPAFSNIFNSGSNAAAIDVSYVTTSFGFELDVFNPNITKKTFFRGGHSDITNTQVASIVGYVNNTTAYTDFTLSTGGTFTGTVNIYGYALS